MNATLPALPLSMGNDLLACSPPLLDDLNLKRCDPSSRRLMRRTLSLDQHRSPPARFEKLLLVKKAGFSTSSAALCGIPASPTSIFQEVDLLQQQEIEQYEIDEQEQERLQADAAISLQAMIRGTLARWNFKVLKLQHKLATIRALKEKQIKKIEQRKVQKLSDAKSEREFVDEHRIVRRRLRRVKMIRNRFGQEKVLALEEHQKLRSSCRYLAQQNEGSAQILSSYIQSMDIAQQNLNASKATKSQLEDTCRTYQTILDVFQQVAFSS